MEVYHNPHVHKKSSFTDGDQQFTDVKYNKTQNVAVLNGC